MPQLMRLVLAPSPPAHNLAVGITELSRMHLTNMPNSTQNKLITYTTSKLTLTLDTRKSTQRSEVEGARLHGRRGVILYQFHDPWAPTHDFSVLRQLHGR